LPFTLLSDEAHEVAEKYGVWKEKTINGQKIWGNERTSFIIGPDGQVEKVFRKVKPETHSQLVLSALADLS
jgi:peroxiredoxin Q/BCP